MEIIDPKDILSTQKKPEDKAAIQRRLLHATAVEREQVGAPSDPLSTRLLAVGNFAAASRPGGLAAGLAAAATFSGCRCLVAGHSRQQAPLLRRISSLKVNLRQPESHAALHCTAPCCSERGFHGASLSTHTPFTRCGPAFPLRGAPSSLCTHAGAAQCGAAAGRGAAQGAQLLAPRRLITSLRAAAPAPPLHSGQSLCCLQCGRALELCTRAGAAACCHELALLRLTQTCRQQRALRLAGRQATYMHSTPTAALQVSELEQQVANQEAILVQALDQVSRWLCGELGAAWVGWPPGIRACRASAGRWQGVHGPGGGWCCSRARGLGGC